MKRTDEIRRLDALYRTHIVIEGRNFTGLNHVLRVAQAHGFSGSASTMATRLKKGIDTWKELLKPTNERRATAIRERNIRHKQEMTDLIATLDARKKEIK